MDNETRKTVETLKADTHDTLDEAKHRAQAGGERLNREVQGDAMPLGERIKSNLSELTHDASAELDRAKRDLRHSGEER